MKPFFALFLLTAILQSNALANTVEVALDKDHLTQTIKLESPLQEPIYERRPYETTCTRQVVDRYEQSCSTYDETVCSGGGTSCSNADDQVCNSHGCVTVPRRSCTTEPESCSTQQRTSCTDTPIYRDEAYSCTQYEDVVVGHRLIKTFYHQVEVEMDSIIAPSGTLQVAVTAQHDQLSAVLKGSFRSAVLNYEVIRQETQDLGTVVNLKQKIKITRGLLAADVEKFNHTSIQNLALSRSNVQFEMPQILNLAPYLMVRLDLVRNRKIGRDVDLFNGQLNKNQLVISSQSDQLQIDIPFSNLGIRNINGLKHDVRVTAQLNPGTVLNASDFNEAMKRTHQAQLKQVNPN